MDTMVNQSLTKRLNPARNISHRDNNCLQLAYTTVRGEPFDSNVTIVQIIFINIIYLANPNVLLMCFSISTRYHSNRLTPRFL